MTTADSKESSQLYRRLDNYVEGFWSGFGLEANFTVIDSEYSASGLDFRLPDNQTLLQRVPVLRRPWTLLKGSAIDTEMRGRTKRNGAVFEFTQAIFGTNKVAWIFPYATILSRLWRQVSSDMNNLADENDSRYAAEKWKSNPK